MRALVDLHEELDEVNFFLKEWLRMKHSTTQSRQCLAEPELRFIIRTLERLIHQAQSLDKGIVLASEVDATEVELVKSNAGIPLTECIRVTTSSGKAIAYVGNSHGLLSINHLAHIVAKGGQITLGAVQP